MTKIDINKTFTNLDECYAWEDAHLSEYTNGRPVFMIMHDSHALNDEITLTCVYVC